VAQGAGGHPAGPCAAQGQPAASQVRRAARVPERLLDEREPIYAWPTSPSKAKTDRTAKTVERIMAALTNAAYAHERTDRSFPRQPQLRHLVQPGSIADAGKLLSPIARGPVPVVTDANVARLHLPAFVDGLKRCALRSAAHREWSRAKVPRVSAGWSGLTTELLATGVDRGAG